MQHRPDVRIEGIDVLIRPATHIQVTQFDGSTIPFPDRAFDVVMFVDVLHHTNDPVALLREATREAARVVLKDHTKDGVLSNTTLRLMDWVGNAHNGVVLPYNYWPEMRWRAAFDQIGLRIGQWQSRLAIYMAVHARVRSRPSVRGQSRGIATSLAHRPGTSIGAQFVRPDAKQSSSRVD
jgi:SAM-dependent methyltransferase